MNKKTLKKIKERLLEEKHRILHKHPQDGDIDSDGDETDKIQANIEIDLQQQYSDLNRNKLNQIEEALERIDQNIFGICVDCDEPIAEKRLLANPHYTTCISCAEDRESEERHQKGF
jgi:DnaK suppressor protein